MPIDQLFTAAGKLTRDNWNVHLKQCPKLARFVLDLAAPVDGWKVFHTATCAPKNRCRSPWEFVDRYKRFMHQHDRRHISWFLAVEPNPDHSRLNPGFHGHALWTEGFGSVTWKATQWWYDRHGDNRFSKIERSFVAEIYCSKYLVKGEKHQCVWEVAGELWRASRGGEVAGIIDRTVPPERPGGEPILKEGF
jgi:hypothetical protein